MTEKRESAIGIRIPFREAWLATLVREEVCGLLRVSFLLRKSCVSQRRFQVPLANLIWIERVQQASGSGIEHSQMCKEQNWVIRKAETGRQREREKG